MAKGAELPASTKAEKVKHTIRMEMPGGMPNMPTDGDVVTIQGKGKVTKTQTGKDWPEAPAKTIIEIECQPGSMSCKPSGKRTREQIEADNPRI